MLNPPDDPFGACQTEQASKWQQYAGTDLPSSTDLFPIFYRYARKDARILDVGCGYGKTVLRLFGEGFAGIHGIDVNTSGIQVARETARQLGYHALVAQLQVANALSIPYPDAYFDSIITQAFWTSILPHERAAVCQEITRLLKEGGMFYIAAWAQNWDLPIYRERYLDGMNKGLGEGAFEVKDPQTGAVKYIAYHYTDEQINDLCSQAGFTLQDYQYVKATTQTGSLIGCHVAMYRK